MLNMVTAKAGTRWPCSRGPHEKGPTGSYAGEGCRRATCVLLEYAVERLVAVDVALVARVLQVVLPYVLPQPLRDVAPHELLAPAEVEDDIAVPVLVQMGRFLLRADTRPPLPPLGGLGEQEECTAAQVGGKGRGAKVCR